MGEGRRGTTNIGGRVAGVVAVALACVGVIWFAGSAAACGGLFCQNDPVDQTGERIVFSVNDDGTVSALIEIQYTGEAADFSWILPVKSAIGADDIAVPEDGQTVFDELHELTDVRIIAPERPECLEDIVMAAEADDASEAGGEVEVFASGEVGPFGFDVIGSEDPNALIDWLREHEYRVDPPMEPLIAAYVDEEFAFVAMRLLDGETSDSIAPVEITYEGTEPMIPLRLTAVAAMDDMAVFTWIFGETRAVPTNYEHFEVGPEDLTFTNFGINDYRQVLIDGADDAGGRAFTTEFAGSARTMGFTHPYLVEQAVEHPYLTRLATYISDFEMTADPVFGFDAALPDRPNVIDASEFTGLYDCERAEGVSIAVDGQSVSGASDASSSDLAESAAAGGSDDDSGGSRVWLVAILAFVLGVGAALVFSLRRAAS